MRGEARRGVSDESTERDPAEEARLARAAEALFHGALQRSDPGKRRRWLEHACGGDARLLAEVEGLVASHQRSTDFLELGPFTDLAARPLVEEPPPADEVDIDATIGEDLGPYRLVERIGEGGFGAVYRAIQSEPVKREVALKIIKLGMDTRRVIARFEAERQALALMDHRSIARVLDAGTTAAGRPYFVMDLVEGVDLTTFCDAERMGIQERCEVFLELCAAVQHAHQRGLIHRDLKPSNVLAARVDGQVRLKVIDFGIAKATTEAPEADEEDLRTEQGQVIGTPVYMSPEQALGQADIDTRTDVYALGVILYELLAGATPLDAADLKGRPDLASFLADVTFPAPSVRLVAGPQSGERAARRGGTVAAVRARIRGDLDNIALKALEPDRDRRYESAASLERDVLRSLEHRPIHASPPSPVYRFRKFIRRHRIGATAGLLVLAALIAGGMVALDSIAARNAQAAEHVELVKVALDPSAIGGEDAVQATRAYEARISRAFGSDAGAFLVGGLATLADRLERSGSIEEALFARRRALAHALTGDGEAAQIVTTRAALGLQLVRMGQLEDGRRELGEAVALDDATSGGSPGVNTARLELARLRLEDGDVAAAEALAVRAREIAESRAESDLRMRADALERLIEVRTRGGDVDGSRRAWEELFQLLARLSASGAAEAARERIRCGRWSASVGENAAAAYDLQKALQSLRDQPDREGLRQLEFEALVAFNEIALAAGDVIPESAARRSLDDERSLARELFDPRSPDYLEALRRVAQHHELRGEPIDELDVLLEVRGALAARAGDSRADEQSESIDGLIRDRLLLAMDRVRAQASTMDERTRDVLERAISAAREADPESQEVIAAKIDFDLRAGNFLSIFELTQGLDTAERDESPIILAWQAAAFSQGNNLQLAERLLERAKAARQGPELFDDQVRQAIELAESFIEAARAKRERARD